MLDRARDHVIGQLLHIRPTCNRAIQFNMQSHLWKTEFRTIPLSFTMPHFHVLDPALFPKKKERNFAASTTHDTYFIHSSSILHIKHKSPFKSYTRSERLSYPRLYAQYATNRAAARASFATTSASARPAATSMGDADRFCKHRKSAACAELRGDIRSAGELLRNRGTLLLIEILSSCH